MDIKFLIGLLGRPWFMEPTQAIKWGNIAQNFISTGVAPAVDKRWMYTDSYNSDLRDAYRIDENGKVDNKNGVFQVLKIEGPVAKYDYCGTPGTVTLSQLATAAIADDSVKGILLVIDSPGGQVSGTEDFANVIRSSTKPVVSYGSMVCSAAYWFGSSANELIISGANDGWDATIGSIGTMCTFEDDTEALQKEGIRRVHIFADESQDKWGDYFAMQKGDFTRIKAELNGINDTFKKAVNTNRAGKINLAKENVLTGKTYNAKEALKHGLIDAIGTYSDAVKRLNKLVKTQIKTTKSMSNHSFQTVMKAVDATELKVVDGGFLLTEEQLNKLDAKLEQDATTNATTAKELKSLQDGKVMADAAIAENATLKASNEDLKTKLAAKETELEEANQKNTSLEEASKTFFGNRSKKGEDPNENGDETINPDSFAHNKAADEMLG